jgi:hypothetical protein
VPLFIREDVIASGISVKSLRLRSDFIEFFALPHSVNRNMSIRAICLPQNSYRYYRGGWGGLGKFAISPIGVEWDKHQKQNRG